MHYCSAKGIAPAAVDDGVLEGMYRALLDESLVQNPYAAYRGAAKSWNNAVDRIPGWPARRLKVPSRKRMPTWTRRLHRHPRSTRCMQARGWHYAPVW